MGRGVAVFALLCGCGRLGFDAPAVVVGGGDDAPAADPDGQPTDVSFDGVLAIDGPIGMGSYNVSEADETYVDPVGLTPVPGFVLGADDENYTLALPFTFRFYGVDYTSVTASMNGYLTFGTPATDVDSYVNDCPNDGTTPDATIAVFWDDLYANAAVPTAMMSTALEGTSPDRKLTVEWKDMDAFYRAGSGNNAFSQGIVVTQKIVLLESGAIELRYGPRTPPAQNRDCGLERDRGCSATVGLEAPGGTLTTPVQCGSAAGAGPGYTPLTDRRVIRFVPN
jgi:hypothetical protein